MDIVAVRKGTGGGEMTTPPRKCPICGIDMEPCDYSPLYGYSWVHPKTENDCKHKDGTLLFGGHKLKEREKQNEDYSTSASRGQ